MFYNTIIIVLLMVRLQLEEGRQFIVGSFKGLHANSFMMYNLIYIMTVWMAFIVWSTRAATIIVDLFFCLIDYWLRSSTFSNIS